MQKATSICRAGWGGGPTHDGSREDQRRDETVNGVAGKRLAGEPFPVDTGLVEAGEADGGAGVDVLLQRAQHHHRSRGVQHVVRRDVQLVVHRLHHGTHNGLVGIKDRTFYQTNNLPPPRPLFFSRSSTKITSYFFLLGK